MLDDAQVVFRVAEPLQVSIGQWKAPFSVSQAMSDRALLFPDRPIPIDGYKFSDVQLDGLGWSRDAGAALLGTVAEKRFEYAVGVFNGDGQNVWPGGTETDGIGAYAQLGYCLPIGIAPGCGGRGSTPLSTGKATRSRSWRRS